ncbi:hypothetical protein C3387_11690 [Leclercia sp. LSNIH6]|uniref:lysozyme inhibitor LprI family protein n=1 Tax=Enterobacter roggenkampii TaxID=1812935 RepID=UPI000CDD5D7A|nr:lysozyme inhibitor LprI family protein [Enterobacter roggenkampii]POU75360.1 hypothetical protein C3370_06690 [Leclercia sp. LSNIH7]POU77674.1 hypothetical protein C3387_11690 [Leclercia sp. LSNIH6]POW50252.1 hypothetical protein C3406_15095 [Leclercia sp. LSNIH8]
MYFKTVVISSSLLFCLSASGEELKQNIDSTLQKCKMDAVSTIASQNCYIKATAEWDLELGNQYKLLMNGQPDNVRIALRDSQRQWIKYRDQYVSAIDVFYKQQGGTISSLNAAESKLNITRDKTIDLYRLRNSTDLSSPATVDNNKIENTEVNNSVGEEKVDEKVVSKVSSDDSSNLKTLACKFVIQTDKTIKEMPGFFAENKMTVLDKGIQFTVLTGDYFNIPDKLISPNNLTSVKNKMIGTGSQQEDGTVSTFSKDSSNYVVTTWASTAFKHTKFKLTLYACK